MKKIILVFGIIIILIATYYWFHPLSAKVKIGDTVFTVDMAVTASQKEQGLGGRPSLCATCGMLFPYDHKEQFEFWMRGMQFPLDFIWIDDKTIVDITENVPPPKANELPIIVKPRSLTNKVLELNAGTVQTYDIRIGDTVTFLDR